MRGILKYLKEHGECMDYEVAAGTGMSIEDVKRELENLAAKGEVIMCHSIQFKDGEQIEGMKCRLSNYVPFFHTAKRSI